MPHMSKKVAQKIIKNSFESRYWSLNRCVLGLDEVGRGCLAGPVVAAAVILPLNRHYRLLKDSKILSEEERNKAYSWITAHCRYAIGILDHRAIDRFNIYKSSQKAMLRALTTLISQEKAHPAAILVDAIPLDLRGTGLDLNTELFYAPKGEQWSSSIAAASIVAKVWRDRLMTSMDQVFPGYALASHKGYATATHQTAILNHGHTIIHRQTYLYKLNERHEGDYATQQTLC